MKYVKYYSSDCGWGPSTAGGHEHEEHETITLYEQDGSELVCDVLAIYEFEGADYIALLPRGKEEVFIYRYAEEEGEPKLSKIEDDDEYYATGEYFFSLFDDEEEESES